MNLISAVRRFLAIWVLVLVCPVECTSYIYFVFFTSLFGLIRGLQEPNECVI